MFLTVVILFAIAAALAAGIGFWAYRVALHLRGDEEATRAVVRHVLMPLVGRTPQPDNPADPRADAD